MASNKTNPKFRPPKAFAKGKPGKKVNITAQVNDKAQKNMGVARQGFNPFR